jgi:hypothetical protein
LLIETMAFRLLPGTDVQAFLRSDRRVQTELIPNRPGFLRRTTARSDDDWLVLTLWASREQAMEYVALTAFNPVQLVFVSHINLNSVFVHRYETLD